MRSNVHTLRGGIPGMAAALLASSVRSFHQPHCVRWRGSIMCLMLVFFFPLLSLLCAGSLVELVSLNLSLHWLIYRARCTRVVSLQVAHTSATNNVLWKNSAGKSSTCQNYFRFVAWFLTVVRVNASINILSEQLHMRWNWVEWNICKEKDLNKSDEQFLECKNNNWTRVSSEKLKFRAF